MLNLQVYDPLVKSNGLVSDQLMYYIDSLVFTLSAFGNYWSLGFNAKLTVSETEDWIENGLGRHVELYDEGLNVVFEGFVSEVSANIGSLSYKRGPLISSVANKIKVVYSTVDTSTDLPSVGMRESTDWAEDADSQNEYGIIERVISVGGASPTNAEQIRDLALERYAIPARDEEDNLASPSEPTMSVTCLGYIHWLDAYTVDLATTGEQNASVKLQAVLAADPNGLFSVDYSNIQTNTTQVGAYDRSDRSAIEVVKGIVAAGDAALDSWTFGFKAGRIAHYTPIPTAPQYQRRVSDPSAMVDYYGGTATVPFWLVQPAEWLVYTDVFISRPDPSSMIEDPRYIFIETLDYAMPRSLTIRGSPTTRLDQLLARLGLGGSYA